MPGGAACLAGHFRAWREEDAITKQLRFLIAVHRIGRVVLIAHRPCAFYSERLGLHEIDLDQRQRDDLVKAAAVVRGLGAQLQVEGFLAALVTDQVLFEPVDV